MYCKSAIYSLLPLPSLPLTTPLSPLPSLPLTTPLHSIPLLIYCASPCVKMSKVVGQQQKETHLSHMGAAHPLNFSKTLDSSLPPPVGGREQP